VRGKERGKERRKGRGKERGKKSESEIERARNKRLSAGKVFEAMHACLGTPADRTRAMF